MGIIARIFRVEINAALREDFERDFETLSLSMVKKAEGCLSVSILKPNNKTPNEYAMITHWRDINALKAFAGARWDEPMIPKAMKKYALKAWVHHYESCDKACQ